MSEFLKELMKDKTNGYSLREVVIAICLLLLVSSWIAQLVFSISTPEYMIYSLVSLIAAGCFGYSIEKKSSINEEKTTV